MTRLTGNERAMVVTALRHAAPYIRMFKGRIFVLKAGGEAFTSAEATRAFIEQVGILHQAGIRVVLVHGGGPQLTELATKLGLANNIVDGRRVTDESTLNASAMTLNGLVNTRILAACRALDIPAIGISGVDAALVKAHKRPPVTRDNGDTVDYGFVGDIDRIEGSVIRKLLDDGFVPIVSSLSADAAGTVLNINADTVAAELACELDAEKLVLATGAPGILESRDDPRSLISYMDGVGLEKLKQENKLLDGMLPKAAAIQTALAGGVSRVHVISYSLPDSLLLEVFTNEGTGTLVVNELEHLSPEESNATS